MNARASVKARVDLMENLHLPVENLRGSARFNYTEL
jgi:hypothetical protein